MSRISIGSCLSILLAGIVGTAISCSSDNSHDCNDGADNDGDGLVDAADPGCEFNGDLEAPDPVLAACEDRVDNDGDGLTDLDDPGCQGPTDDDEANDVVPQCRDGVDNDSDGLVDFPNDPGCMVSLQDSENDECPSGATCPDCANGADDDGDGTTDYPDDLGCNGASDDDETSAAPPVCSGVLSSITIGSPTLGTLVDGASNDLISQGCAGTGPERAYQLTLATPSALQISTNFSETTIDTVVYLQSTCGDVDSELGCNDDATAVSSSDLFLTRVEAGSYVLVVDSHPGANGDFKLQVDAFTPEGEGCNPAAANCAPNLSCRLVGASETCEEPLLGPTCEDMGTTRTKVVPTAGDLVISEYMANPSSVGDALGEWFEVRVTANVDIGGLELGRAEIATGAGPVILTLNPTECLPVTAGTHLLFAREADTLLNGGLPAVDHVVGFGIVNSNDGLFIGLDGNVLDLTTYTSTVDGAATSLDPAAPTFCTATTSYGDGDLGTPGAANPICPTP
jgi:hypothetical protein